MKKSFILPSIAAAAVLSTAATVNIINNTAAESADATSVVNASGNAPAAVLAENTSSSLSVSAGGLGASSAAVSSKDQTVYAIADAAGSVRTKFVGGTLYQGDAELPFNLAVKYYLDGEEISGADLKGKSGHVKIVYSYESTAEYQGSRVPFVALTALSLDTAKFANVTVDNGKLVTLNNKYTVVGYSVLGLNENLGTDLPPSSFTMEADVTDFALGTSYTVLTNEVFAELDTSKLSELDGVVGSVNELSNGLNQLISGSSSLTDGLATALSGAKALGSGASELAQGISAAATGAADLAAGASDALNGAEKLNSGLSQITAYNDVLNAGATQVITSTLTSLNTTVFSDPTLSALLGASGITEITLENYNTVISAITAQAGEIPSLTQAKGLLDLSTGIIGYTGNVATAAAGAGDLTAGLAQLSSGAGDLAAGLAQVSGGAAQLSYNMGNLVTGLDTIYQGSVTLGQGLTTFKTSGVDKLVNFANNDLSSFTSNLRASVSAASSYTSFNGAAGVESVKFIVKVAGV
ncbi:hypothetical protein IJ135_01390 [Candidatus Saccharibacteria bacterium]|nr:hypothetical protein [Candidatus Saccharibacteria bacterium]